MPATSPAHPRRRRRTTRLLATAAGVLTAGALAAAALPGSANAGEQHANKGKHGHPGRYQDIQLLSFNDLHGNLEPPTGSSGRVTELQPDGSTTTIDAGGAGDHNARVLDVASNEPIAAVRRGHFELLVAKGWETPLVYRTAAKDADPDIAEWAKSHLPPEGGVFR